VTCNSRAAKAVDDDVMGEKYEVQSAFVDQYCVMKIVIIIDEIIKVLAPQVQIAFWQQKHEILYPSSL